MLYNEVPRSCISCHQFSVAIFPIKRTYLYHLSLYNIKSHLFSALRKTHEDAATIHPLTTRMSSTMERTGTPTFRRIPESLSEIMGFCSDTSWTCAAVWSGGCLAVLVVAFGGVWSCVVISVGEWSVDELVDPLVSVVL